MPTAATVAIAKWHNPQRASANDRFAPSSRSFETSLAQPESCRAFGIERLAATRPNLGHSLTAEPGHKAPFRWGGQKVR